MKRKTYAYNSIIIGFLIGLWVYFSTGENLVWAILAGLAVAVAGFFLIRFLETLVEKGVDTAVAAVTGLFNRKKEQKNEEEPKDQDPA